MEGVNIMVECPCCRKFIFVNSKERDAGRVACNCGTTIVLAVRIPMAA
jgi:hypothetical protein